jgi:transcriptional regulator with XRE-family HTH domain
MAIPGPSLLQDWRRTEGLNQVQAAQLLEMSQSNLSDIEAGRQRPRIETALRIERRTKGAVPVTAWAERRKAAKKRPKNSRARRAAS